MLLQPSCCCFLSLFLPLNSTGKCYLLLGLCWRLSLWLKELGGNFSPSQADFGSPVGGVAPSSDLKKKGSGISRTPQLCSGGRLAAADHLYALQLSLQKNCRGDDGGHTESEAAEQRYLEHQNHTIREKEESNWRTSEHPILSSTFFKPSKMSSQGFGLCSLPRCLLNLA